MKRNNTFLQVCKSNLKLGKLFPLGLKNWGIAVALLLFQSVSFGQTILYNESMDNGTGGTNGDLISTHQDNGRFSESSLTFSGTGDMRDTDPSTGYTSASGGFNVMFNSIGESFKMDSLDFSACLSDIKLSFGFKKTTNASDGSAFLIQYNTYSQPTVFNKITFDPLPTGSGTAIWYYITATSLIPSDVLSIRFSSTSGTQFRLDDINVECNTVVCASPTIKNNPVNHSACEGQPVTFGCFAESTTTLTYQWQVDTGTGFTDLTNGAPYSGVNKDSLKIASVTGTMNNYKYRCQVTNVCGSSNTTAGTLTVTTVPIPTITASGPVTLCLGQTVTLTSSAASNNLWSNGAITQAITVNGGATYTVKATVNNCSATSAPTIVTVKDPSFSLDNFINPTTCISTDGSAKMNGSGSGVVTWTGAATGTSTTAVPLPYNLGGLIGGTYTVTFTAMPGCSSSETLTLLADIPVPTITSSGPLTFCEGDSITLTSSATLGNTWSPGGATTKSIVVKTSGTYNTTVTSGSCVKVSRDTIVTVNPKAILNVTSTTNPSACGVSDGVIQISGTGTGTISWTGAATGSMTGVTLPVDITGLGAGAYTISFVIGTCQSIDVTASLNDPGAPATPTITAGGPTTFCAGDMVTLTSSSATNNTWSTGETSQSITVSTTSSITVSVTVTGCTSTSLVTEVVSNAYPAVPVISVQDTVGICTGDSVTLTSSALNNNTWSTGATTRSIIVKNAGTYNVVVSNNGCTSTSTDTTVVVSATANLLVGATTDPSSCGATNGVITINALDGPDQNGTLSWTGPTNGDAGVTPITLPYTASGLSTGSYDFTFNSGVGCVGNATVAISGPNTLPTISASAATTFCEGGSVTLQSSSAVGNTWSDGSTGTNLIVTTSGSYTVTVVDGGCTLTSAPTVVTVNTKPVLTSTMNSPTICGDTDGSLVIDAVGAGTGNLIWTGTASGSANSINLPFTVTNLAAGSYTFRFDDGCPSLLYDFEVQESSLPATPVITASGPLNICSGQSVVLTSNVTNNIAWITGDTDPSISASFSGNYTVTVTEGFCTETSDPVTVTVTSSPAVPVISSSDADNTVCDGTTVTLSSNAGGSTIWSDAGSTQAASLDVTSSGTFTASITVNGCTSTSASTTVTVNPKPAKPTISADGPLTFCDGGSVNLTSSATSGLQWSTGVNTVSISINYAGTFSVTVTANGCSNVSDQISTVVNPNPTAILSAYNPICDTALTLTLNQGLPAGGTYTVDGSSATSFDPDPSNVGTHTIVYTVTQNGCSGSATQPLVVKSCSSGVGIDEATISRFVIYPNPSTGIIQIEGEESKQIVSISIHDQLGREVRTYNSSDFGQIDLTEVQNGVYTLLIKGNNFEEVKRIQILK